MYGNSIGDNLFHLKCVESSNNMADTNVDVENVVINEEESLSKDSFDTEEEIDPKVVEDDQEEARQLIQNTKRPKTDNSSGDVLFELYDSMERFTTERIILVAKKIKLDEDILIEMLQANTEMAKQTKRRIGDGKRRRRDRLSESLQASGLL